MAKTSWRDLEVLGRRNNKIIKYMETLLIKARNDGTATEAGNEALTEYNRLKAELAKGVSQ